MKYTIDATDKVLGRIASEAASVLIGKNTTAFQKNAVAATNVEVINAAKMKVSEKKMDSEKYASHSGYPGNQKLLSKQHMAEKHGIEEVIRRAIYKMLPKNRLQDKRIKFLKIVK